MTLIIFILCTSLLVNVGAIDEEVHYHDSPIEIESRSLPAFKAAAEADSSFWINKAQHVVKTNLELEQVLNQNKAKNIILFLGDGMGIQTTSATRAYIESEEYELSFEKFPHFGLSKTYCIDSQVADSGCSATAYLSGVKGNYRTIGLNGKVRRRDCTGGLDKSTHTESIAGWAQKAGKGTGIVTTTRVTHASPAGVYANIASRDWEDDYEINYDGCDPTQIQDIAQQLVYSDIGKNLKVVLGGGRRNFRNSTHTDEEGYSTYRSDGRNLIDEWKTERSKDGEASYVWNKQQLNAIDISKTDYILGLFEGTHCMYNQQIMDNKLENMEPTLTEMTAIAIKMLQKEENGFFLFVEGGRIDHAHHDNRAMRSLDETKEFARAIELAQQMTNDKETLIVVTADHSHAFTYNGYAVRSNNVLGNGGNGQDALPYQTLSYANGPGYDQTYLNTGVRRDYRSDDIYLPTRRYAATVPLESETHGGEDVGIYASGPQSHLFVGNYEQNNIPVIMAYIADIGPYYENSSSYVLSSFSLICCGLLVLIFKI